MGINFLKFYFISFYFNFLLVKQVLGELTPFVTVKILVLSVRLRESRNMAKVML